MTRFDEFKQKIEELKQFVYGDEHFPQFIRDDIFSSLYKELKHTFDVALNDTATQPSIIDFSGNKTSTISLQDLISEKKPGSFLEISTTMTYYMEIMLEESVITIENINEAYAACNIEPPKHQLQNLRDLASNKYGYITFLDGKIKLTSRGKDLIEKKLPK